MTQPTPESAPAPAKQASFGIQRIFLKGMSLELPMGPKLFLQAGQTQMNLAMQTNNEKLDDNGAYEVSMRATLSSTMGDKTLYLLEVEQAGIFIVRDMNEHQVADILDIAAPSILAPYLRAQLSDTLTRATLPVFILPEINWAAAAMDKRAKAAGGQAGEAPRQIH